MKTTQLNSSVVIQQPQQSPQNILPDASVLSRHLDPSLSSAIAGAQGALTAGTQAFVDQTATLTAATSSPGTGQFLSSIIGRAPIPDITKDLKVSFGIERIMIQQIYEVQNEFGSNGERVWAAVNDSLGLIRFVGNWVTQPASSNGMWPYSQSVNDYAEIVFYGTGLNFFSLQGGYDLRATVDGGAEGGNLFTAGGSTPIANRNYSVNQVVPVVSGLSLGLHTVKLRTASSTPLLGGFEVLNTSSTTSLNINPGTVYSNGLKLASSSVTTTPYNSTFDEGTLGSRGGRVQVYMKTDGTIKKTVSSGAPNQLASAFGYAGTGYDGGTADHVGDLEELQKTYYAKEFGAGRSDDFSFYQGSATNLAFTLDDGTTTLVANQCTMSPYSPLGEMITLSTASSSFVSFTFVGTGLDVTWGSSASGTNTNANSYQVFVDGVSVGNLPQTVTANIVTLTKIVSGLPYGTHVVKILRNVPDVWSLRVMAFKVYAPKRYGLLSGEVELADYFVMANYVANSNSDAWYLGTGVLRKNLTREATYTGTWGAVNVDPAQAGGFDIPMQTSDTLSYTFFGTGFDIRCFTNGGGSFVGVLSIDGSSNLSSFTTGYYGAGIASFVASTGTITATTTSNAANGITVSGLTLGKHTLTLSKSSGSSNNVFPSVIDIITPIYSPKSNLYVGYQNTLSVGSCSLYDRRQTSLSKGLVTTPKASVMAVGAISDTTTTSTSMVSLDGLSTVIVTQGGPIDIFFSAITTNSVTGNFNYFVPVIDGNVPPGGAGANGYISVKLFDSTANNGRTNVSTCWSQQVSAGTHTVAIYWSTSSGTATCTGVWRTMLVRER